MSCLVIQAMSKNLLEKLYILESLRKSSLIYLTILGMIISSILKPKLMYLRNRQITIQLPQIVIQLGNQIMMTFIFHFTTCLEDFGLMTFGITMIAMIIKI